MSHAAATPQQICLAGRAIAAGKYAQCVQDAPAKYNRDSGFFFPPAGGKCVTRYAATWAKLQAKVMGSGSTCDQLRFADNGDGTVTDHLTGLQWEKKTNLDGTANAFDCNCAVRRVEWALRHFVDIADAAMLSSY